MILPFLFDRTPVAPRPKAVWGVSLCLLLLAQLLVGCGSTAKARPEVADADSPMAATSEHVTSDGGAGLLDIYDPWEPFNRRMYAFNAKFDRHVFLPAVGAYERLPIFVQDRFHNFFRNLDDIGNLINSILQLKFDVAVKTSSRLVWNTTLGVFGLWDPATFMGIPKQREDFGQTLGHWGVGPGPYLVLPILGPSSGRDGFGKIVDAVIFLETNPVNFLDHPVYSTAYTSLYAVDKRSNLNFRYYQTGSPFEYDLVRSLYTNLREVQISN